MDSKMVTGEQSINLIDRSSIKSVQNPESVTESAQEKIALSSGGDYVRNFKDDDEAIEFLNTLVEGYGVCGDSRIPMESKPEWFDPDKFRRGQIVSQKYMPAVGLSVITTLILLFTLPEALPTLIFTGKSDTPFKAFKRYLSTGLKILSWFEDDLWDPSTEGYKNMKSVRTVHEHVRRKVSSMDHDEFVRKSTLSRTWSPLRDELKEDFKDACPMNSASWNALGKQNKNQVPFNQTEMALTQFGLTGLFIGYPRWFGAHRITDDELDSYMYVWRVIGYMLGIEDKYNFFNCSLKTAKKRISVIINSAVKPSLIELTRDWEHMSRCLVEGLGYNSKMMSFEGCLLYLCDIIELDIPKTRRKITFKQKISYYIIYFYSWFLLRIPGVLTLLAWAGKNSLKKAENIPPEMLKKLENMKYPLVANTTDS